MKRSIFCGAQEGPLTGDFLPGAAGLGRLPRKRWCWSWGARTLRGLSLRTEVPTPTSGAAGLPEPALAWNKTLFAWTDHFRHLCAGQGHQGLGGSGRGDWKLRRVGSKGGQGLTGWALETEQKGYFKGTDIWYWGCTVHFRLFSSICGLYPLDAGRKMTIWEAI